MKSLNVIINENNEETVTLCELAFCRQGGWRWGTQDVGFFEQVVQSWASSAGRAPTSVGWRYAGMPTAYRPHPTLVSLREDLGRAEILASGQERISGESRLSQILARGQDESIYIYWIYILELLELLFLRVLSAGGELKFWSKEWWHRKVLLELLFRKLFKNSLYKK